MTSQHADLAFDLHDLNLPDAVRDTLQAWSRTFSDPAQQMRDHVDRTQLHMAEDHGWDDEAFTLAFSEALDPLLQHDCSLAPVIAIDHAVSLLVSSIEAMCRDDRAEIAVLNAHGLAIQVCAAVYHGAMAQVASHFGGASFDPEPASTQH